MKNNNCLKDAHKNFRCSITLQSSKKSESDLIDAIEEKKKLGITVAYLIRESLRKNLLGKK